MKKVHLVIIVLLVLIADQAIKIYVKTSFPLNTSKAVVGNWFNLYFVENPGMAYGLKFGGSWGKLALTVFRLLAVVFGTWYLGSIIKRGYNKAFIICASLIYAGAIGNLIDSCFYGLIFDKGMLYNSAMNGYTDYNGLATFAKQGYSSFLHGNVVDMLYFPVIDCKMPSWMPEWFGDGNGRLVFFRPIFNIADAAISTGVITIILFQKRMFGQHIKGKEHQGIETISLTDDVSQVS